MAKHERTPHEACGKCHIVYLVSRARRHSCAAAQLPTVDPSDTNLVRKTGATSISVQSTTSFRPDNTEEVEDGSSNTATLPSTLDHANPGSQPAANLLDIDNGISDAEAAAAEYQARWPRAIAECKSAVDVQYEQAEDGTLAKEDLHKYKDILANGVPGRSITADEYLSSHRDGPTDEFIICSSSEARQLLKAGPPLLPILVPARLNLPESNHRMANEVTLQYMQALPSVDLQTFDHGERMEVPTNMQSHEAVERLCRPAEFGPSNALNLRGRKDNPVPACIAGIPNYNVLKSVVNDNGKPQTKLRTDWEAASQFAIFGGAGALSNSHIDRGGVITAMFCDDGEKLWVIWPGWQIDHLQTFCKTGDMASKGVLLYMRAGDLLIQPQGTLHSPYSPCLVGMSGSMYLHTHQVLGALRLASLELQFRHVTNEDLSPDFVPLMEQVLQLWESESRPWTWDNKDKLVEAREILKVRLRPYDAELFDLC